VRPRLDAWTDFGSDFEYANAPFLEFQARVNAEGCAAFRAAHPDLPLTEKNSQALIDWCALERVPMTRGNLSTAWGELKSEGKLEAKSVAQEAIGKLVTSEIEIRPVEAAQVAEPTADEKATLDKLRDDPSLSDGTRKKRDEQLRRVATQSRIARRRHDPNKTNRRILIS
jgi:hypothetical protein